MKNGQVLTVEEQNKYLKELQEKGQVTIEENLYFKDRVYTVEECMERLFTENKLKTKKITWEIDDCFNLTNIILSKGINEIYAANNTEFIVIDYRNYNFIKWGEFKLETINHFAERLDMQNLKELEEEYLNKEMSLWDLDSIREEAYLDLMHYDSFKKKMKFYFSKNEIEYTAYFTITKFVVNRYDGEIEIDLDNFKDDEKIELDKIKKIIGEEIEWYDINWEESKGIITEIGF